MRNVSLSVTWLLLTVSGYVTWQAAAAAEKESTEALAEIVVTAEKTTATLSSVPISISALSGAQLEDEHITDYADLARAVPNLSFTSFGGPGQSNIEIRGVSSQAGSATTGIYLDEVPINVLNIYTTGATEPRFFDIDRIEVLRGPQGTIYGASSMGGTLHFVSALPDLENFSGYAHAKTGGTQGGGLDYQTDGVVNLPLAQGKAALRVGALYDQESGWIDRVDQQGNTLAKRINQVDTTVVRATLELKPLESLTIIPAAFLQRVTTGGQDLFNFDLPRFESATHVAETQRDEFAITSLTAKYDFKWSELTSVTGYFWRDDHRLIDGTFYDSVFLGQILQQQYGFGGDTIGGLAAPVKFYTNINQVHEELRLASKPAGPDDRWSWIAGLYYSRTRTGLLDDEHIPGFSSTFTSIYGQDPETALGATFPDDLIYYALSEFTNTQSAVFGQVSYKPVPRLRFTAGTRYEKAKEELAFTTTGYFAGGSPQYSGSANGSATTPKFSASYDISDKAMVYASAAQGYRDGGVNRPVPVPLCSADLATLGLTQAPASYNSDKLWSYEFGVKSRALNDTLSMSAALFDIRWTDIQTDVVLPTCIFDIKVNIGTAESRGFELELAQKLDEHFSVDLGGNYTSAKIVDPVTVLGVERGDRVPGVPDYSVSAALEYTHAIADKGRGSVRLNGQWTGTSQGTIFHGDPDFDRPSYFVMGVTAGAKFGNYDLSFFVTNLLNQGKVIQRPNVAGVEYGVTVRPRTYGIGGTYHF